jgi:hypothetical protein
MKTRRPERNIVDDHVMAWVERVAEFWSEQSGLPPITGRIVGWLMICDPPEQSAAEIAEAVQASRASLTTSTRLLIAKGLIRTKRKPGQRTAYYRIEDDAWEGLLRRRIMSIGSFRDITREGLALLGVGSSRSARIRAADEVYEWAEKLFAQAPPIRSNKPGASKGSGSRR